MKTSTEYFAMTPDSRALVHAWPPGYSTNVADA